MKIIAKVIGMIDDELEGAEEYAKSALQCAVEYPKLAQKFNDLAQTELQHVKLLHAEVTRLIEEKRQKDGEPPAIMLAIYNFEHEKQIKRTAEIRGYINEFSA